jgi:CRISPR-associated protein Cmr6
MIRPLAKDANAAVERALADCKNLGLILDKYQPFQPVDERQSGGIWDLLMRVEADKGRERGWQPETRKSGEARGLWFGGPPDKRIRLMDPELSPNSRIQKEVLAPFLARWQSSVAAAGAVVFTMWTESPLIIGLGVKGTLETALTLHPLYGFPYLPGSALKGISRAAAFFDLARKLGIEAVDNAEFLRLKARKEKTPLQKLAETLDDDERLEMNDVSKWPEVLRSHEEEIREFRHLFGWRGGAGGTIFFDGVPARVPVIVPEAMTPHFKGHYSEGTPPHDADSPNPISLLVVAAHTHFGFAVGWRNKAGNIKYRDRAVDWLAEGLTNIGLGGKTASGYGFFVEGNPKPSKIDVKSPEPDVSSYRPPSRRQAGGTPPSSQKPPDHPEPPPPRPDKGEDFMSQWAEKRRRDGDT